MAISRNKVSIYIVPINTAPSALTTSDIIRGEITNYSKSGGEIDVETVPAFGGFIDKEKPQTQFELSFDIVPQLTSDTSTTMRWENMAYYNDGGTYTSARSPTDKMVVIEARNGANYKSVAFNNCNVTVLDMEHSADDNQSYTMNLKFSPTTPSGQPNFMSKAVAATSLPTWGTLTNANTTSTS